MPRGLCWLAIAALASCLAWGCDGDVGSAPGGESTATECSDGMDNDNNGLIDCQEQACAGIAGCPWTPTPATDGGPGPIPTGDSGTPGKIWKTCSKTSGEAKPTASGVDIIWFIDTSGSMRQETAWVKQNLNNFAQFIGAKNLDYRVILIGRSICVAPPLGGPNCGDGPRYRYVNQYVGSTDGLQKVISTYSRWQSFLRPGVAKNFVAVTDDNSRVPASWFNAEIKKLTNPGFPGGFFFHSIVAYGSDPRRGCSTGARIGQVYLDLTTQTKGVKFQVCLKDWKPIFSQLAQSVAATAKPPCNYAIPSPGTGKTVNPKQYLITWENKGKTITIPNAGSQATCGTSPGFYYDKPTKPTSVTLCPETCKNLQGGKINVEFGCLSDIG